MLIAFILVAQLQAGPTSVAKNAVQELYRAMMPVFKSRKGEQEFRVRKCGGKKKAWLAYLIQKKPHNFQYQFKAGCDIEGTINARADNYLLVKLKLRNVEPFKRVEMSVRPDVTPGFQYKVIFKNFEGKLISSSGKETIFDADYSITVDPLKKGAVVENAGGNVVFRKLLGKEVKVKEKLFISP